jgi:rhodanese-related sulfurtransferase
MEIEKILDNIKNLGSTLDLPYFGAASPQEAFDVLRGSEDSVLVDVRTKAEWNFVGVVPGSIQIEWQFFPGGSVNTEFLNQLVSQVEDIKTVFFLCRSGARSHAAALLASSNGYKKAINILEGFEGDKDENGQRGKLGGWRFHGLPWVQG